MFVYLYSCKNELVSPDRSSILEWLPHLSLWVKWHTSYPFFFGNSLNHLRSQLLYFWDFGIFRGFIHLLGFCINRYGELSGQILEHSPMCCRWSSWQWRLDLAAMFFSPAFSCCSTCQAVPSKLYGFVLESSLKKRAVCYSFCIRFLSNFSSFRRSSSSFEELLPYTPTLLPSQPI